ncbi:MAG: hypothetical protein IT378_02935 [Sandaracinaceae bacterium]|nr:hypothetical protein [Sandaracinaceae bacterium]
MTLLAQLFLRQAERQLGLSPRKLGRDAQALLASHAFPGNVRELRAVMRRACILADGDSIGADHLQLDAVARSQSAQSDLGALELPLEQARDQFVIRYVSAVLERHEGNREAAAAALGISVRSLYRYLSPA